jgi:hypothetical protein
MAVSFAKLPELVRKQTAGAIATAQSLTGRSHDVRHSNRRSDGGDNDNKGGHHLIEGGLHHQICRLASRTLPVRSCLPQYFGPKNTGEDCELADKKKNNNRVLHDLLLGQQQFVG